MSLRIIGGIFRGRRIKAPKNEATRPALESLRESMFNICQNRIQGATVLDLFAGSGAIGFEALSRGANSVIFVEKDRKAMRAISENIELLDVKTQAKLIPMDAFLVLPKLKSHFFDLICIDPPYDIVNQEMKEGLFMQILDLGLLHEKGVLFFEERVSAKQKAIPCEIEGLHLKSSRRFGSTSLEEYIRQ